MKKYPVLNILCLAITFLFLQTAYADDLKEDEPFTETFNSEQQHEKPPSVNAGSAIVMDQKSGRVLYEKDAYRIRPMASTTKIMTAIVAIENGNLDDIVTVSKNAASIWGSKLNLREGERFTLRELLYGLMLNSGNDASIAIAEHIGGSVESFLEMMNRKAAEIGAKNTCFKTPHGLDVPGHYTTAYDLALITRYALDNPVFSDIVGTKATAISDISLYNTNEMLTSYPGADGVKTGYTGQAGRCLVTSATRDGMRLISVVLYSPTRYARALSSADILDYSFYNYKEESLTGKGDSIAELPIHKGVHAFLKISAAESVSYPLKKDGTDVLVKKIFLPPVIKAPVAEGETVGSLEYILNGCQVASTPLIADCGVDRKGILDYLWNLIYSWSKIMREGMFYELQNPA